MAEHFPAAIDIGGPITRALAVPLVEKVATSGASLEWGGQSFTPDSIDDLMAAVDPDLGLLSLRDDQATCGEFSDLETWLTEHRIAFDRHTDAHYEMDGVAVSFRPGIDKLERTATQDGDPTVRLAELERVRHLLRAALRERSPEQVRGALAALEEAMGPEVPPLEPFAIVDGAA